MYLVLGMSVLFQEMLKQLMLVRYPFIVRITKRGAEGLVTMKVVITILYAARI